MSLRLLYLFGGGICIAALAFAYFYLEAKLGLEPCPLCIFDRIVLAIMAGFFVLGFIHNPALLGRRIYAFFTLSMSLLGCALAGRHIYLQNLPPDQVPGCLPDFGYMLEEFPLLETIQMVLNSAGECAEIDWTFLGLTIPQQTLLVFIVLAVLSLVLFRRQKP